MADRRERTLGAPTRRPVSAFVRALVPLTFALTWLLPARAQACTCLESNLDELLKEADAVFIGRVADGAMLPQKFRAQLARDLLPMLTRAFRFEVLRGFKGIDSGQGATVLTGSGGSDCGVSYRLGETLVVFARKGLVAGLMTTDTCSGGGASITRDLVTELERRFPGSPGARAPTTAQPPQPCPREQTLIDLAAKSGVVLRGLSVSGCIVDDDSGDTVHALRANVVWKGVSEGELVRVRVPAAAPRIDVGGSVLVFGERQQDGSVRANPCAGEMQTPEYLAALKLPAKDYEGRIRAVMAAEDGLEPEIQSFRGRAVSGEERYDAPTLLESSAARCGELDVTSFSASTSAPAASTGRSDEPVARPAPRRNGCGGCATSSTAAGSWTLFVLAASALAAAMSRRTSAG